LPIRQVSCGISNMPNISHIHPTTSVMFFFYLEQLSQGLL
jgi:hypothetical protein